MLGIGDGALGFWGALREVFPDTAEQRYWFHKIGNVVAALPKSTHPGARKATKAFEVDYGAIGSYRSWFEGVIARGSVSNDQEAHGGVHAMTLDQSALLELTAAWGSNQSISPATRADEEEYVEGLIDLDEFGRRVRA